MSTFHRSDFFDLVDRDDSIIGSDRSRTRGVFQPVLLEIEGKGTFVDGWMDGWMDGSLNDSMERANRELPRLA